MSDTIVGMSQLAGAPLERKSPKIPDGLELDGSNPIYGLDELLTPNGPSKTSLTQGPESQVEERYEAHARVFIVGPDVDHNAEYVDLLNKGANGEIILARREINDMQGSASFKVYIEWMVPVKKKKKLKERRGA